MPHGAASRRTAALLFAALTTAAADTCETTPIPTVIVADVGVDDALALLWAVASPSLDVLGVAASFGGHADPRMTARNALRVLAAANRSDIPVFVGSLYPFGQATMMRGNTFHGVDGFGDVPMMDSEPPATEPSSGTSAAEFIAASARRHAGKLVVLCFSPLVDVALASLLEPTLPSLLSQLVVMGHGSHTVDTLTTATHHASSRARISRHAHHVHVWNR
jgi:purine nucleosidase